MFRVLRAAPFPLIAAPRPYTLSARTPRPIKETSSQMIVTIDGPAGSGKSSLAKRVAKALRWMYLDTGATYRAVAYQAQRQGLDIHQPEELDRLCRTLDLDFQWADNGDLRVIVDGADVSDAIRTEQISSFASRVATLPQVRNAMVDKQRQLAAQFDNVVTEGRDQGTVVFPHAQLKIFLDASVEERAKRRQLQLEQSGQPADYDQILQAIRQRDNQDSTRATAPLVAAEDAVKLDTTNLTLDQVETKVLELIQAKRSSRP